MADASTRRRLQRTALRAAAPLLAVGLALFAGAVAIAALGKNPLAVYGELVGGTLLRHPFTGWYGLGQVIYKATTLTLTGVAVAFSFRAGLFNIGAEGQLALGGFAAALAGLYLPSLGPLTPVVCLSAAFLGGALAAAIPAVLKAVRGTHEVIVTIMMNFIVIAVVNWLTGMLQVSETVHTEVLPDAARLSKFSGAFPGSAANASAFVAVTVAVWASYLLARTRTGLDMRAVGHNPRAAAATGIAVPRTLALSLLISGGIAGLGAANFVLGNKGYFEKGFTAGAGFLGIAVALLARNAPWATIPAALLFAVLSEGAVAVGAAQDAARRVPRELFDILQAVIILFVIVSASLLDRVIDRLDQPAPPGEPAPGEAAPALPPAAPRAGDEDGGGSAP